MCMYTYSGGLISRSWSVVVVVVGVVVVGVVVVVVVLSSGSSKSIDLIAVNPCKNPARLIHTMHHKIFCFLLFLCI
jgi:hypothetical protein